MVAVSRGGLVWAAMTRLKGLSLHPNLDNLILTAMVLSAVSSSNLQPARIERIELNELLLLLLRASGARYLADGVLHINKKFCPIYLEGSLTLQRRSSSRLLKYPTNRLGSIYSTSTDHRSARDPLFHVRHSLCRRQYDGSAYASALRRAAIIERVATVPSPLEMAISSPLTFLFTVFNRRRTRLKSIELDLVARKRCASQPQNSRT